MRITNVAISAMSVVLICCWACPASSWEGRDTQTGNSVSIEKGNLVRPGEDIEVYDYDSGEYRGMTVDSISRFGGTVELEVYDSVSGEQRTLEMDGD